MRDINTFIVARWEIIGVANSSACNSGYICSIVDKVTYPFLLIQHHHPPFKESPPVGVKIFGTPWDMMEPYEKNGIATINTMVLFCT